MLTMRLYEPPPPPPTATTVMLPLPELFMAVAVESNVAPNI